MADNEIDASKITSPIQLLAACLVFISILESAFITGASELSNPAWAPGLFVVAAVLDPIIIIWIIFRLYTKYRVELLNDDKYVRYLADQASSIAPQLGRLLSESGLNFRAVLAGKEIGADAAPEITSKISALVKTIAKLSDNGIDYSDVPTPAILEAARGLFAEHKWLEAAKLLDEYAARVGDDWEVHFSRGAAYANARSSEQTTRAALRAFNEAEAFMPPSAPIDMRARLLSYRGGMKKRLGLLREARADLLIAEGFAERDYERADIAYNLAGVYALLGEKELAYLELRNLPPDFQEDVWAHRYDYFASIADDPPFQAFCKRSA